MKIFDNNEFDDVIRNILSTLFDDYYINRNKYVYCIDNLYKKYDISKYNFKKKKYGIIKSDKLIFRFNRYSKKSYIIKLLKDNYIVVLDENESYDSISDDILKVSNIKSYKRYINNMLINRKIDRNMFIEIDISVKKVCKKECANYLKKVDNDFKKWGYTNCLRCICEGNYCQNHYKL